MTVLQVVDVPRPEPKPGTKLALPPRWPLARDRVRHAGEAVAMVVAETVGQARDAAERVSPRLFLGLFEVLLRVARERRGQVVERLGQRQLHAVDDLEAHLDLLGHAAQQMAATR